MDPITQGVAGDAVWTAVMAVGAVVPDKIEIISLRRQGRSPTRSLWGRPQLCPKRNAKEAREGHQIWVMTQDDVTCAFGRRASPQCSMTLYEGFGRTE
jgi:hypothetical protein